MYKITNIQDLGTDYTVADKSGNVIKMIQVIPHTEILEAAHGEYKESDGTVESYMQKSVAVLAGFDKIDPTRTMWYATTDEEIILSEVFEQALRLGYDRIILEHLTEAN